MILSGCFRSMIQSQRGNAWSTTNSLRHRSHRGAPSLSHCPMSNSSLMRVNIHLIGSFTGCGGSALQIALSLGYTIHYSIFSPRDLELLKSSIFLQDLECQFTWSDHQVAKVAWRKLYTSWSSKGKNRTQRKNPSRFISLLAYSESILTQNNFSVVHLHSHRMH